MAHKRTSSRHQDAGPSLGLSSHYSGNPSLAATCSTPDIAIPSSDVALSQSTNSLPSAQSLRSDLSLPSFTSSSASSSSDSGLSSYAFSSSISSDQVSAATLPDSEGSAASEKCDCSDSTPKPSQRTRLPFQDYTQHPAGVCDLLKSAFTDCATAVRLCLPDSLWDRLILVAFFYYAYVFFSALVYSSLHYHSAHMPCHLVPSGDVVAQPSVTTRPELVENLSAFPWDSHALVGEHILAPTVAQDDHPSLLGDFQVRPVSVLDTAVSSFRAVLAEGDISSPATIEKNTDQAYLRSPRESTEDLSTHLLRHFDPAFAMYDRENVHHAEDEPSAPMDDMVECV